MKNAKYYNTDISGIVRLGSKAYRISVRNKVPYVTYRRRTRVLFSNPVGGAFINVEGSRVYFR